MKSIFSYSNYRSFLSDFYERKKRNSSYSYRQFSKAAGLDSPNYLALVMQGKRGLTTANIQQFSIALDFRSDEVEYFETLVLANQSTNTIEKRFYERRRKKLLKHKPKNISKHSPSPSMSEWYYTGTLVLSHGHTIEEATKKIQSLLNISATEIVKTLQDQLILGLLRKGIDEKLEIASGQVTFHDTKGFSIAQEKFLSAQLQQSTKAFQNTYANKTGKFLSHTLTIPEGALPQIQQKLLSTMEDLTAEMDAQTDAGSSKLAQINMQIFHPQKWD